MRLDFFGRLTCFNAQVLDGNALLVRAFGAMGGGTIKRSKDYLLFGNGMASLVPWASHPLVPGLPTQYVVRITERTDRRKRAGKPGSTYWEIQGVADQSTPAAWYLDVAETDPDPTGTAHAHVLVRQDGNPGQYFYVSPLA